MEVCGMLAFGVVEGYLTCVEKACGRRREYVAVESIGM